MTFSLTRSVAHGLLLALLPALSAPAAEPKAAEPKAAEPADDAAAVRASIQAYVEAFNRADAKALAALWSETGEWVAPSGDRLRGRAAIEKAMQAVFAAAPGARLEVVDPTVRLLTADVALEEGTVRVVRDGQASEESTYQAVHVKRAGTWQLESVRETAAPAVEAPDNPLAALAWMVGQWSDRSAESEVETKIDWTLNKRFLVCHFKAEFPGMEPLVGSQVIGYDAAAGAIRSWLFDADGTIGEGTWTHDGKQWVVKSTQVLADGRRASATNIYRPIDSDRYAWKSIGRKVEGEFLPNIEEVVVVRKGSAAATPAEAATPAAAPAAPTEPQK